MLFVNETASDDPQEGYDPTFCLWIEIQVHCFFKARKLKKKKSLLCYSVIKGGTITLVWNYNLFNIM